MYLEMQVNCKVLECWYAFADVGAIYFRVWMNKNRYLIRYLGGRASWEEIDVWPFGTVKPFGA